MSENKSTVGDPIWVESCMTAEEHVLSHKLYPTTVLKVKPRQYNPAYHKGGKWRNGMGYYLSAEEIHNINANIDYLLTYVNTKNQS